MCVHTMRVETESDVTRDDEEMTVWGGRLPPHHSKFLCLLNYTLKLYSEMILLLLAFLCSLIFSPGSMAARSPAFARSSFLSASSRRKATPRSRVASRHQTRSSSLSSSSSGNGCCLIHHTPACTLCSGSGISLVRLREDRCSMGLSAPACYRCGSGCCSCGTEVN